MSTLITSPSQCRLLIPPSDATSRLDCITETSKLLPYRYETSSMVWLAEVFSGPILWVAIGICVFFLFYALAVIGNAALTGRQKWGWVVLGLVALPFAFGLYLALSPTPPAAKESLARHRST